MTHYCTYFDAGFLLQGLALARSLAGHHPNSKLWVLALDGRVTDILSRLTDPLLCVVPLHQLERDDPDLAAVQSTRSRAEYYFTLSPIWPRWILKNHPEIEHITYIDADLLFFSNPSPIHAALDEFKASALITSHRFPQWLKHYERHGRFNVGVEVFRNDATGRAVLDHWRLQCLDWCFDRLENDRYADQKYLDAWPANYGKNVLVLEHAGVNLAPWNWPTHSLSVGADGRVLCDGVALIVFHFARFRPLCGTWWWQSGNLDYGVMPWKLRQAIYGTYWRALQDARRELAGVDVKIDFPRRQTRFDRSFWRGLLLRFLFGSDWLRIGNVFISGRLGMGRFSGHFLNHLRTIFLRRNRNTDARSQTTHRSAP